MIIDVVKKAAAPSTSATAILCAYCISGHAKNLLDYFDKIENGSFTFSDE